MLTLDDYLKLLSPSNYLKPRFHALAEAVLSQVMELFNLLSAVQSSIALDSAVGVSLDTVGALVGIPRPASNTSDADYRFYLRARIAASQWNGTNETLPDVLAFAFPDRTAELVDNLNGTVTMRLSGDAPPFPLSSLFPLPAGVRALTE